MNSKIDDEHIVKSILSEYGSMNYFRASRSDKGRYEVTFEKKRALNDCLRDIGGFNSLFKIQKLSAKKDSTPVKSEGVGKLTQDEDLIEHSALDAAMLEVEVQAEKGSDPLRELPTPGKKYSPISKSKFRHKGLQIKPEQDSVIYQKVCRFYYRASAEFNL